MKFLTAVALAVVMLWVPVDGVAQARSGDWGIRIEEDPFTDEKTSTITHFHTMLENINSVVLSCEGTYPPRLLVMTKVLLGSQWQGPYPERTNPEWDARAVTLTYRLGDDPPRTVTAPILSVRENPFATTVYSLSPSEPLALISSPRIAIRIQGVDETFQQNWTDLEGTTEAVRSLHCVR